MCGCKPAPGGQVIVCDPCAAQMVAAISDLLPGDQYAADLPQVLTASAYQGLQGAVNGWLDGLQPNGSQGQREARR
jgi:hypothetical protein